MRSKKSFFLEGIFSLHISTPENFLALEAKHPRNYGQALLYYTSCCGRGLAMAHIEERVGYVNNGQAR